MNSFIENVNYVAGLDNRYGRSVEIFKNNLSLRTESYDVKIKFTYYNYQTSELIDVLAPYNAVSISGFEGMINNFKSQINSLLGGNKFICTSTFSYTDFAINNVATIDIKINSLDDMIKTYGLNIIITSGSNELYNINGIANDTLKILPYVALFDSESLIGIKEINNNIVGLNLISSNINEILLANDNAISVNENAIIASNSAISATASANIATTKASEALTSATSSSTSAGIATTKATEASSSAASALASKNAASTSETNALASKNAASTSETNALASKNAAATSATNSATSATSAIASKNAASTSATSASGSATASSNSATASATSATNASASATSASTSSTSATASATSAATSASTATTKAAAADVSATNAASSAASASTSSINASNSATASATSSINSANSATAAAASAASAAAIAGGSISLDSLNNVTAPTPANGDILSYVTATTDWRPLAILPVAKGGTGVATSTGTGNVVLSTSPTLVTPNIGVATGTSFNSITGLATVAPLIAGTATVGTSTLAARQDHTHPVQTSVTGNAATATTLQTAITINGVAFNGSANITVSDSTAVKLTGNETVAGIKTFTSSPIVPTPTTDFQAATKQYVDDSISRVNTGPYGISWDYATDTYIRTGSKGYTAIQSMMRRCVLNADGTVNYYLNQDNSNFKEDGTPSVLTGADGNVMVEIPKHYIKVGTVGNVDSFSVSLTLETGYVLDPAFLKWNGTAMVEVPYRYFRAYEGFVSGGKLLSVSGVTPTQTPTQTIATFRTQAMANGAGWHLTDWNLLNTIKRLCYIEFCDFIVTKYLGNGNDTGSDFGITTGQSNALGNRSSNSTHNDKYMSYRGIENMYADMWEFVDGVNVNNYQLYVNGKYSTFQSDVFTGDYVAKGPLTVAEASNSLIKRCAVSSDGGFIPTVVAGSTTTFYGDALWSTIGARIVLYGGSANNGASDGLGTLLVNAASSISSTVLCAAVCR